MTPRHHPLIVLYQLAGLFRAAGISPSPDDWHGIFLQAKVPPELPITTVLGMPVTMPAGVR